MRHQHTPRNEAKAGIRIFEATGEKAAMGRFPPACELTNGHSRRQTYVGTACQTLLNTQK